MSTDDPEAQYRLAVDALKEETADGLGGARLDAVYQRTLEQEQAPYDAALGQLRRQSEAGLGVRLEAVYRRISAELDRRSASNRRVGFVLTGAFALIAAGVFGWWVSSARPVLMPPQPDAQIALRTGEVDLPAEVTLLRGGEGLRLAPGARVDLDLGGQARIGLEGPAQAHLGADRRPRIDSGIAHFWVAKRSPGNPFIIEAGDSRVIVKGTRFSVDVEGGQLRRVRVTEGTVQIEGPRALVLNAGDALTDAALGELTVDLLDRPWFAPLAHRGHLLVTSAPDGAEVEVDGVVAGSAPLLLRCAPGPRSLRVSRSGFEPWRAAVLVTDGQLARVDARLGALEPEPAVALDLPTKHPTVPSQRVRPAGKTPDPWELAQARLEAKSCVELDRVLAKKALDTPGDDVRATMLRAECRLRRGERSAALALYRGIVAKYPDTAATEPAVFEASKLLVELGRQAEALASFEGYLQKYPQGRFAPAASFRVCELQIELSRLDLARACLEHYRVAFPTEVRAGETQLLLATIARSQSRWADAAALYQRYASSGAGVPRRDEALFLRVVCLQRGQLAGLEQAVDDYLTAYPAGSHADEVRALKR